MLAICHLLWGKKLNQACIWMIMFYFLQHHLSNMIYYLLYNIYHNGLTHYIQTKGGGEAKVRLHIVLI